MKKIFVMTMVAAALTVAGCSEKEEETMKVFDKYPTLKFVSGHWGRPHPLLRGLPLLQAKGLRRLPLGLVAHRGTERADSPQECRTAV